jgi:hypothetical protein
MLSGTFGLNINLHDFQAAGLAGSIDIPSGLTNVFQISNGSGAGQGTQLYGNKRVLSGTTDVVNLTSLTDNHGAPIDFATIKGIGAVNNSASHTLVLGAGTNPWATLFNATGTLTLPPGAFFAASTPDATGWTTTVTTAINLLATGTSGETWTLLLFG